MMQGAVQVSQSVAEEIRARIAVGKWVVGQRLPSITELAQEFGVSTGSAREAVKSLAMQGLLSVQHGRGTFVLSLHPAVTLYSQFQNLHTGSILELWEARRILEPELAAFAAERGSDYERQNIRCHALEMERLVTAGKDFLESDLQFHRQIALAAHNAVLAQMLDGVSDLLVDSRTITAGLPGMTIRAVRYHLLIADTLIDQNPAQARLLMLAHVNDAITSVLHWQNRGTKSDLSHMQRTPAYPVVHMQR